MSFADHQDFLPDSEESSEPSKKEPEKEDEKDAKHPKIKMHFLLKECFYRSPR